jgi:Second Messenger Oligonucleotide or Dinucleotide Synthetase domain
MADNPFDPKYSGGLFRLLGKPPEPENPLARALGLPASPRPVARTNPFSAAVSDLFPSSSAAATQGAAHDLLGPSALSSLLGHNQPPEQHLWYYVTPRFKSLLSNLAVSEQHREAGLKKFNNVVASLNRRYYDHSSDTLNGIVIGSWGKKTQIAPPRDVDVLFLLPDHVYHQFQQRSGNRQSQLLQEVKDALLVTNSRTSMHADRQVVVVPFDAVTVEVAVGFRCMDGSIIVCDSKGEGSYATSTAIAEAEELDLSDRVWNSNTRALIRLIKCWQDNCNVPLKSFMIERLAADFLFQWEYHLKGVFYYDWMVRDFFAYLLRYVNGSVIMPGGETILLGSEWFSRAQTAHRNAISACANERDNNQYLAGADWQKIFGSKIPAGVL